MKKILQWIVNFLTGKDTKVQKIFEDIQNKYGSKTIQALEDAKDFLNRADVGGFVAWTKTPTDDKVYDAAKAALPNILVEAGRVQGIVKSTDNYQIALSQVISHISTLPKDGKGTWWRELSGMMAQILADGKITWSDLSIFVSGVWAIYNSIKK